MDKHTPPEDETVKIKEYEEDKAKSRLELVSLGLA